MPKSLSEIAEGRENKMLIKIVRWASDTDRLPDRFFVLPRSVFEQVSHFMQTGEATPVLRQKLQSAVGEWNTYSPDPKGPLETLESWEREYLVSQVVPTLGEELEADLEVTESF